MKAKLYWILENVMLVGKNKVTQCEVWIKGTRDLLILKFPVSEIWGPVTKKSQYTLMITVHRQDGNLDGSEWEILWKFFVIQICSVNANIEQGSIVLCRRLTRRSLRGLHTWSWFIDSTNQFYIFFQL